MRARVWALAFYAGLRRGELRALRVDYVDFDAGLVRVRRGWYDVEGEIALVDTETGMGGLRRGLSSVVDPRLTSGGRVGIVPYQPAVNRRSEMSAPISDSEVEQRLEGLERRLATTMAVVSQNEVRLRALQGVAAAERRKRLGPLAVVEAPPERERAQVRKQARLGEPGVVRKPARFAEGVVVVDGAPAWRAARSDGTSLGDFLGGRALAWLGGIATLLGIVLLLALAISHGWLGHEARVGLAAAGSAALMAAGIWLHARRGRSEAAVAMVGAATAASFATLIVAAEVYHLIPTLVGVAGSMLVGALATALAIRWAGRAIAVLGLIGALLSPVLVGAPSNGSTIAMLAIAAACAMWVVLWRRWPWLPFAAVLVCAPQWAAWMAHGHAPVADLAVLVVFGSLGLLGAVFVQQRSQDDSLVRSAAALALLNAVIVGAGGRLALGATGGGVWLAGMAFAYAGAGLWRWPRIAIHDTMTRLLVAIGVTAGDAALGLSVHGLALPAAWGATAIGFAWLVRRTDRAGADEPWLELGLGTHIGLVLTRALIELPPNQLAAGPRLAALASMAILVATCLGSARVTGRDRDRWRMALDALGLLAVGYLTAETLDGPALVGAWTLEAVGLAQIGRRINDRVARHGGLAFLAVAALYTLTVEAPPSALVSGASSLVAAALALGMVAVGALRAGLIAQRSSPVRQSLLASSGLAVLYLASVAIITVFQPATGTGSEIVLDLSVRQQGQVLLSALWGVVGVAGLVAGLRNNIVPLRTAALVLLLATVAKVFLYDLSTLTSIYRVVSFLVLGGLLLAGALAYQRLRPPPPPDLRTMHPSQR